MEGFYAGGIGGRLLSIELAGKGGKEDISLFFRDGLYNGVVFIVLDGVCRVPGQGVALCRETGRGSAEDLVDSWGSITLALSSEQTLKDGGLLASLGRIGRVGGFSWFFLDLAHRHGDGSGEVFGLFGAVETLDGRVLDACRSGGDAIAIGGGDGDGSSARLLRLHAVSQAQEFFIDGLLVGARVGRGVGALPRRLWTLFHGG